MAESKETKRFCFVIGPIGSTGTPQRNKADWLLKGIVKPVLEGEFDFLVKRADEIAVPGSITEQVINATLDADLVVADLTDQNPNAFYELAIRHMIERPVIQMVEVGQTIPFDIKDFRTVSYALSHPDEVTHAAAELKKQVRAVLDKKFKVSNPITAARGKVELRQSSDTRDQLISSLSSVVTDIQRRLQVLEANEDRLPDFIADSEVTRGATLAELLARSEEHGRPRPPRSQWTDVLKRQLAMRQPMPTLSKEERERIVEELLKDGEMEKILAKEKKKGS